MQKMLLEFLIYVILDGSIFMNLKVLNIWKIKQIYLAILLLILIIMILPSLGRVKLNFKLK